MSHCWKCGTKLDEDAKFCHVCGTPVGTPTVSPPPPPRPVMRKGWSPLYTLAIVLGAILIFGAIVGAFVFLPVRSVSFNESHQVLSENGVNAADLDLSADVARFNITFADLNGRVMTMNVSANGGAGLWSSSDILNVTLNHRRIGNTLFVNSTVSRVGVWWPWFGGINVVCDVRIDRSLNLTLNVKTSTGNVVMVASGAVVFDSLHLETTTGAVEASLNRDVVVNGAVLIKSTTGSTGFSWDDAKAARDIAVDVKTTTGGVDLNVTQDSSTHGNVTLNAGAVTGSVDLEMMIRNDVGAVINSSTAVGGVSANTSGFSGTKSQLQSTNYPAPSNFILSLSTTTGGVNVSATYTSNEHM
jgi:hypothetical protein